MALLNFMFKFEHFLLGIGEAFFKDQRRNGELTLHKY